MTTCNICMELSSKMDMIQVKCGHYFHQKCLFTWVIQDPEQRAEMQYYNDMLPLVGTCPTCRCTLHQVFDRRVCQDRKRTRRMWGKWRRERV